MSEFDQIERKLLEVAYDIFSESHRAPTLRGLMNRSFSNMGLEGWMQTELGVGLANRKYDVGIVHKVKAGCDLIVSRVNLVELRAAIQDNDGQQAKWLFNGIVRHPRATLYIFLCRSSNGKTISTLQGLAMKKFLRELAAEPKELGVCDWILILAKNLADSKLRQQVCEQEKEKAKCKHRRD